jgi:hypothetical protein
MPYKNPKRDRKYKREYELQKARGEHEDRMERQRARRAVDKKGIDRSGKDVSHKKPLSRGGANSDGYRLESPSTNRARGGAMSKPYTKTKKPKKK